MYTKLIAQYTGTNLYVQDKCFKNGCHEYGNFWPINFV